MTTNRYADPSRGTRRWITAWLIVGGALAGAVLGLALTPIGKFVTGAQPADAANFIRNAVAFGMMGACIGPLVTWSALRNAPFWRTVLEPLGGCVAGAATGAVIGSPELFLALIPIGGGIATARLAWAHRSSRDAALVQATKRVSIAGR